MSFKSQDAQQLLDNPIFRYAIETVRDEMISRIVQNPIDDAEATIGLSVLSKIESSIESLVFDERIEEYNKVQSVKYQ